jgi:hypothetical protein
MSRRTPFSFCAMSNMLGHSQTAIAVWMVLFMPETAIISEPRQATGRT